MEICGSRRQCCCLVVFCIISVLGVTGMDIRVTFLALETVAWEQRLFQTKVLISLWEPGLCHVAVRGDRLFRS